MKTKEVRELSTKEIQERMDAENATLVRLKLNHSVSPLDNPKQITVVRKTIAKMQTELRQREINQK